MFWQKIGNSVSDRLFRDSVIAENQCLYYSNLTAIVLFHKFTCTLFIMKGSLYAWTVFSCFHKQNTF